jgi:arylsulfatase A-like enzyme
MLTGKLAFRQKGTGVLPGDADLIIPSGSTTLPSILQTKGYTTGVVGKWHLGMGKGKVDWNQEIKPNPSDIGFDYHFLMPATGDRVPCVYVEQGKVVDLDPSDPIKVNYKERIDRRPSGAESKDSLKMKWSHGHDQTIVNGVSRIGWMTGGAKARWIDEDMADVFTQHALQFIEKNAKSPFFLYFATHDIHVPRVPHSRFAGKSGTGPRGDAMLQLDWCVGEVLRKLDDLGIADNTLILFTSDNGPVLDDGYVDEANEKLGTHDPNGMFRAGKYSLFEGGTRVPMVIRWPAKIKAGQVSSALFGQIDLTRSLAALVGAALAESDCSDARDELDTLLGNDAIGRPFLVHEAGGLALRQGAWKLIPAAKVREDLGPWKTATLDSPSLFDLASDPAESKNLAKQMPDKVQEMQKLLKSIRGD